MLFYIIDLSIVTNLVPFRTNFQSEFLLSPKYPIILKWLLIWTYQFQMFLHSGYAGLFSRIQYHIHVHITIINIQPHDACVELIAYIQLITCFFFATISLKKENIWHPLLLLLYAHQSQSCCCMSIKVSGEQNHFNKRQQSHAWSDWVKAFGSGKFWYSYRIVCFLLRDFQSPLKKHVKFPQKKSRKNDCPRT